MNKQASNKRYQTKTAPKPFIPEHHLDKFSPERRGKLVEMPLSRQQRLLDAYRRNYKSVAAGFLTCLLLFSHYVYLGDWKKQRLFWLTIGGVGIWWLIDLIRMPLLVSRRNSALRSRLVRQFQQSDMEYENLKTPNATTARRANL